MPRTASDVGMPSQMAWPPEGWIEATCTKAAKWTSPKKKTAAVMLSWESLDARYNWEDPVYVTAKAIKRLNLVAQRVCGMPRETQLPDDDKAAANLLARYILDHAAGRSALVLVESQEQNFLYESGPKVGQKRIVKIHRVAFAGYEPLADQAKPLPDEAPDLPRNSRAPQPPPELDNEEPEEDLPF